jgi:hypothetical protein
VAKRDWRKAVGSDRHNDYHAPKDDTEQIRRLPT